LKTIANPVNSLRKSVVAVGTTVPEERVKDLKIPDDLKERYDGLLKLRAMHESDTDWGWTAEHQNPTKEAISLIERIARMKANNEQLKVALAGYAVTMSYDYPAEAPVECGLWCDLCKEHIDDGVGHKPTCLLI
jgi:hypothetical protein